MFILNREEFHGADKSRLVQFIECWERYYREAVAISPNDRQPIDYFAELNIDADLTHQNVTRLLRWKDPRMLTHPKSDGNENQRVVRILGYLDSLNQFRRNEIDRHDFSRIVADIFPNGIVWQLFLFHIARPWEWPIADQHVFRACRALFTVPIPQTLGEFEQYRGRFANLADQLAQEDGAERISVVRRNKRLDNALMAFGQFLLVYDR